MLNKVQLIGRLARDPEVTQTRGGSSVVKFTLATDSKKQDEKVTEWHRCVAFQKTAELIAQLLRKGSLAYIEGKLHYGSYVVDNHGSENEEEQRVYTTDIMVDSFQLLSPRETRPEADAPAVQAAPQKTQPEDPDDLPF